VDIADLPNIGPTSADWLRAAGVETIGDLEAAGPVAAFLAVRAAGHAPSLNLLWALAAGLRGEHWARLPEAIRDGLRRELADAEG
jgi:DNA transformation protein